jgi:hypothetical protein
MPPELQGLLDQARTTVLSEDELLEQRASFIYGNAPKGSRITKESARASARRVLLMPQDGG